MSWTKSICYFAFCALLAAPAMAAPTLDITQTSLAGGQRTFGVFVTPDPTLFSVDTNSDTVADASSMAFELAITSVNPKGGAVPQFTGTPTVTNNFLDDAIAPIGNFGDNPFTGTRTEGITVQPNGTQLFAALGSTGNLTLFPNNGLLSTRTLAFSFTVNDDIAVFNIAGSLAQGDGGPGSVTALSGSFGIAGDFDKDGDVETNDFGVFSGRFGNPADANNTGDFDLDGDVDTSDFGVFSGNFGRTLPAAGSLATVAVPEPSTVLSAVLMLGLGLGFVRRRS